MASVLFLLLRFVILIHAFLLIHAQNQNLSTSTPVPPLQWINLSNLLQGSPKPPPLRDAAIGYDETSRSLIIFGGLSESGIAQSQTFLLNLETLSWSAPNPPTNLQGTPSARSAVVSGSDFAASNRHGFIIIGGKDENGNALSDVWEYDFNNQFWSEVVLSPGGPSARWGASGGIDIRTPSISDPILAGPNNTFFLAGGFDGKTTSPLSDVWKLNISGTLSSNLPNSVQASWDHVVIGNLPGRIDEAGTVISTHIIAAGGCDSTGVPTASNNTCARQESFIIDVQGQTTISPGFCPAPRVGPVLVANMNGFSTSFGSQVFMLLGTSNSTLWQDSNGLNRGEVAVLDMNTGTWTRVIPSGDVDTSGTQQVPSPREGATAISFSQSLVGTSRSISADTIVFGGQDGAGNFLADLWLLRAYSGVITPSSPTWSGFGDGHLQTGVNADGSGVAVQYLTDCATFVPPKQTSTISSSSGASATGSPHPSKTTSASGTSTSSPDGSVSTLHDPHLFETAFVHKLLLPLSIVLLLPILLIFRWADINTMQTGVDSAGSWLTMSGGRSSPAVLSSATLLGAAAYGVGVAGFILSFTTISTSKPITKRLHLRTAHGIVGLLFFLCLYALVPLVYLASFAGRRRRAHSYGPDSLSHQTETVPSSSFEVANEKAEPTPPLRPRSLTPSLQTTGLLNGKASPPSSPLPRQRSMSWDASTALRPNHDSGVSDESTPSPTPHKTFEVIRPGRARKLSEPWRTSTGAHTQARLSDVNHPQRVPSTRRLGEIDWLLRRRSLNAVGELDYAITQAHNERYLAEAVNGRHNIADTPMYDFPPDSSVILRHILLQVSILGLCAVALSALFLRAKRYLFVLFLIWAAAYYLTMLLLAYHGRPTSSILLAAILRLRGQPTIPAAETSSMPTPSSIQAGPYKHHRPPVTLASTQPDDQSHLHSNPLSVHSQDNEDDEEMDDDERQRAIEEEMERRDVSIVTVPRRKLYLTNPS